MIRKAASWGHREVFPRLLVVSLPLSRHPFLSGIFYPVCLHDSPYHKDFTSCSAWFFYPRGYQLAQGCRVLLQLEGWLWKWSISGKQFPASVACQTWVGKTISLVCKITGVCFFPTPSTIHTLS